MRRGETGRAPVAAVFALVSLLFLAPGQGPSLDGVGHDEGDPAAPLEVVEFLDFGCTHCARFSAEVLPSLTAEFVATGRVRWKYVPIVLGPFRHSGLAAEAAECAAAQGAFRAMHDRLLASQREWGRTSRPDSVFRAYAAGLPLDASRFGECLGERAMKERVRQHGRLARRYGVRGTPTFVLDRRDRLEGALPLALFRERLAARLPPERQ